MAVEKFLSPKNDFVFKKLFTKDTDILTDLINSALGLSSRRRIVSVEIKNAEIPPKEIEKKFIILDILAIDGSGKEYDIEMQVRRYENYPKRTLYYLCRMYGDQLASGEDYLALHPVIGIHFLDYALFPEPADFHYRFALRDIRYPDLRLNDDLSLHIFELPGIERHMRMEQSDDIMGWLHFFNHAHMEGGDAMKAHYNNPMIHRAIDALKALSADEKTRELAERREKALKDEAMFLNEAKRMGIEQGIEQTAMNMLHSKLLSKGQISGITGLGMEKLDELERRLNQSPGNE